MTTWREAWAAIVGKHWRSDTPEQPETESEERKITPTEGSRFQ